MTTRSHRLWWLASVIIAFVLGYLLGRRMCVKDMAASGGTADGGVIARGDGSQGPPGHVKIGTGAGGASSSGGHTNSPSGGIDTANGGGGTGGGGSTDGGNGGGYGVLPPGGGQFKKVATSKDTLARNEVGGSSESAAGVAASIAESTPPDPKAHTLTAHDFSYDSTRLPRYPNATEVASTITTKPDSPTDTSSACAIVTGDSFDAVVAWYQSHLPPTWHQTVIANMQQTAKELTVQNIVKMLGQAANGSGPPDSASSSPQPHTSIGIWTAPDDNPRQHRGVMVTTKTGESTKIVLTRAVQR